MDVRRSGGGTRDPLEISIEDALQPEDFISDHDCYKFVRNLELMRDGLSEISDIDPQRSVALYESFLAGCQAKAEQIDDSSGCFGSFVGSLACGWVGSRQKADADPDETAARLLKWMDSDEYGFSFSMERELGLVFDPAGSDAFVTLIRARFEQARQDEAVASERRRVLRSDHHGTMLRTIFLVRKDLPAYRSFMEQSGLADRDYHAMATLLIAHGDWKEALDWIDRGLASARMAPSGEISNTLVHLQREVLAKLGRQDEARESAWAAYSKHPSLSTYNDLMAFVADSECSHWQELAYEALAAAPLDSRLEILLKTDALKRLVELISACSDEALEGLSHFVTEPVAQRLAESHPGAAGRLWLAQGLRIVNARKSRYYREALSNFAHAKRCLERAGEASVWQITVQCVRAAHQRKGGFITGFERLVAGIYPEDTPSFVDRAKARFGI